MKTGGIFIALIGGALFIWHLAKVAANPDYEGYASHQVMSINAVVLVLFGAAIYFLGRRRIKGKRKSDAAQDRKEDVDG